MRPASFACCAAFLLLTACDLDPGDHGSGPAAPDGSRSIAGSYALTEVDGLALPCCTAPDSTGDAVTILSGWLTLGDAAPEEFVNTPSGYSMAESCVHEIPNGAVVDTGGLVHLPDGRSYRVPDCGDAPYAFSITERHEQGEASRTVVVTDTGQYVWGGKQITLVGKGTAPTRLGELGNHLGGLFIAVQHYESFPPTPSGHRYGFTMK